MKRLFVFISELVTCPRCHGRGYIEIGNGDTEECKHKAPTKFQFNEFVNEHSAQPMCGDFKAKGKVEGSGKAIVEELDTEIYD